MMYAHSMASFSFTVLSSANKRSLNETIPLMSELSVVTDTKGSVF